MGLAGAPATESIMGSLPPERANIGSAVNDTTRELGGALGVAVVGSIMSSLYAAQRSPAPAAAATRSAPPSQAGGAVADAAREAFVHAMSTASISSRVVAALGALIAWRHLPATEPTAEQQRPVQRPVLVVSDRVGPWATRPETQLGKTKPAVAVPSGLKSRRLAA